MVSDMWQDRRSKGGGVLFIVLPRKYLNASVQPGQILQAGYKSEFASLEVDSAW